MTAHDNDSTLAQTGRRAAAARSSAPSLGPEEAEILHALALNLKVKRKKSGWMLPSGRFADQNAVDALITKRFVIYDADKLVITDEGKKAIRAALDDIVNRAAEWLKTLRRKAD